MGENFNQADGITQLIIENRNYKKQVESLTQEIGRLNMTITDMERDYNALRDDYDRYLNEYSEKILELVELKQIYELAIQRVKEIQKDYKAEAGKWIAELKKKRKVV